MQSMDWAKEHSEALREFLNSGMSYSRAVDAINAKCKTAYSRNAAIGRLGLAGPDRFKDWPELPLSAAAPRLHELREHFT
jgi:GcrA cell cycle regulator